MSYADAWVVVPIVAVFYAPFLYFMWLGWRDGVLRTEYKLVQMKLLDSTVKRIEELQEKVGARNRTDAVSRAIDIADIVVKAVKAGKSVVIESPDGSRERLLVPGLM